VAARLKQAEEFWFFVVERTEPRGERVWVRSRREPIDGCIAAGISGTEFVSVTALGLDGKPVAIHRKSFAIDDTALVGRLGSESDGPVRQPANSERKHASIQPERRLTPILGW
jgi:hypothetical protein